MSSGKKPTTTPQPRITPGSAGSGSKKMSSRLLTMKFMQKATNTALTHSAGNTTTPTSKSSIREAQRDKAALQAALAEEEIKNRESLRKLAEEGGEAMWELSFLTPTPTKGAVKVEKVSYADLVIGHDEELESGWRTNGKNGYSTIQMTSRTRPDNGNGKMKQEAQQPIKQEEQDSSNSEDEGQTNSAPLAPKTPGRLTFGNFVRAQPTPPVAVDANPSDDDESDGEEKPITSLSGTNQRPQYACHGCGQMGHLAIDCPQRAKRGSDRESLDNRDKKRAKIERFERRGGDSAFRGRGRGAGGRGEGGRR